jgi:tripartite-type tricarboxylate transporter receptor subunit TctC
MNTRRRTLQTAALRGLLALAGLASVVATPILAQAPTGLRIVVPYPPGGGSDRSARLVAEALQTRLGVPVVVENITGAGGRLALRQLAAQNDAHVLVLANPALMVVAPLVYKNNGYDVGRDFQPVAQISSYEFALATASAVPVREFNHLMAWVRANPEKANLGVPATGSLPHFFALMASQAAKAPLQVVGYRGSAPLSTDLIGGHLPMAIDGLDTLLPLHEGGKLRILATSGATRSVPTLPTFKEAGLNLSATGWNVLYARTSMPAAQVERLSKDIAAVMQQPGIRQQFVAAKVDPVSADLPATQAMLKAFKAQWVPAIQQAGLQFE